MEHVNLFLVFTEGLLSFISPCVLPILPVYLSLLSASSVDNVKTGAVKPWNGLLLRNTLLFILGISSVFFILGSSVSAFSQYFRAHRDTISLMGGILIMLLGGFYLGVIQIPFLNREKKIHMEAEADGKAMKPVTAFLLGFTFSLGWTPCIGPMLASVLIMASGQTDVVRGNSLILVYTLGFVIPFVLLALFYSRLIKVVDWLKRNMGAIQKIGGAILLISGLLLTLGGPEKAWASVKNLVSGYSQSSTEKESQSPLPSSSASPEENAGEGNSSGNNGNDPNDTEKNKVMAPDFALKDQYGKTHTLSDYEGSVVFLNFWATWCPPCVAEMPHIEDLYQEYGEKGEDVIILGVAAPNYGREGSEEEIKAFLEDNGYTFPVVMDYNGEISSLYGISAYPTTFIVNADKSLRGYVEGAMDKETMIYIIENER